MAAQASAAAAAVIVALMLTAGGAAARHGGGDGSAVEKWEVTALPGFQGEFASRHYAGYVAVGDGDRQLYYYLTESQRAPSDDALILWLNGGPGCSSFDGWVYEHGPFNFVPGAEPGTLPTLVANPFAWSTIASILYVDSPACVGFSYSTSRADCETDDFQTARDLHEFLLKWLHAFPKFQGNPFYVAGESYGGIYVPMIAWEVAKGIHEGVQPRISFQGYMVGNGCTDEVFDGNAIVPFAYGMGLISIDLYEKLEKACHGSYWNATGACLALLDHLYEEVADLDIYDILEPCFHDDKEPQASGGTGDGGSGVKLPSSFVGLGRSNPRALPVRTRMAGRAWPLRSPVRPGRVPMWPELVQRQAGKSAGGDDGGGERAIVSGVVGLGSPYVPCFDDVVATLWLNDPDVRRALHARPAAEIGRWELCTQSLHYKHNAGSMIPKHRSLTLAGFRALIYSGDHDMCVPYTGTESWTRSLGYRVTDHWRPWFLGDQVAGFTRRYAHGLTFATVKGAGHTVPEYKPAEALAMLTRFLSDEPL
eukprot:SM000014S00381  [mRNA]  locus=s14:1000135:1004860:+ [translate_table: standard]